MLKTPELESDLKSEPETALKCWSLGKREHRLAQPGCFRTDVGVTARILRRTFRGRPWKILENEAVVTTASETMPRPLTRGS
jgi:hypothetical protein